MMVCISNPKHYILEEIHECISSIQYYIDKHGFNDATLAEALPYYMQCRAKIIRIAKQKNIPLREAFDLLAESMPHIHTYCETDFKKVLRHRLEYYHAFIHLRGYYSVYMTKHPINKSNSVKTSFIEDGNLTLYHTQNHIKRPLEFSCAMFSQKANITAKAEATHITTEKEDAKNHKIFKM